MTRTRIAVIGGGHLGKIHTRLLLTQDDVDLVAVAEPSPLAQRQLIDQFDVPVVSDYRKLVGEIDAAVVATPTRLHYEIASLLLQSGIDVLVEKPLTDSVRDAEELVELARSEGRTLAVGHVERFNPAIQKALECVGEPRFVQAARLSGFTFRSTDIGVVHDLMIHDIDLVNSIFRAPCADVTAAGVAMFGAHEDISQATLQFEGGGMANLTASRCSYENQRSFQIFGTQGYANVDLAESRVTVVRIPEWFQQRKYDLLDTTAEQQAFIRDNLFSKVLPREEIEVPRSNAILEEQKDWLAAIGQQRLPTVSGGDGAAAVAIADRVIRSIAANAWNEQSPAFGLPQSYPFGLPVAETSQKRAA